MPRSSTPPLHDERVVRPALADLWLCADLDAIDAPTAVRRAVQVCSLTPAVVWLRASAALPARTVCDVAKALRASLPSTSRLFVGDRVDIALAADADGVHLGRRSLSARDARLISERSERRRALLVSGAVHDGHVVARSPECDALVLSPLFAVEGKGAALGPAGFATIVSSAPARFFVALGGIENAQRARAAAMAGASAIAVRRAFCNRDDAAAACIALIEAFRDRSDR